MDAVIVSLVLLIVLVFVSICFGLSVFYLIDMLMEDQRELNAIYAQILVEKGKETITERNKS